MANETSDATDESLIRQIRDAGGYVLAEAARAILAERRHGGDVSTVDLDALSEDAWVRVVNAMAEQGELVLRSACSSD